MGRKSRLKKDRRIKAGRPQALDLLETPFGKLHLAATELAERCANRSATRYADAPDDIVRGALFVILQDSLITHYAVLTLVKNGYASAAAANLRTLLDLFIAAVAIVHSKDSRLMAFRYFYSSYRELSRDEGFSKQERAAARAEMRERIQLLPEVDRPAALSFVKGRNRAYFFSDEWKSPTDVLNSYASVNLSFLYRKLSSAAHGGFMGLRTFRDEPDSRNVRPQFPPGRRALGTLLFSSRILGELVTVKSTREQLGLERSAQQLQVMLREVAFPSAPAGT